jgi:hypothetical protein
MVNEHFGATISGGQEDVSMLASSRVAQQFKALHLSTTGVTTDPGSIPGCIIIGPTSSGLGFS